MTDYEKVCWYCAGTNMEPVDTWFRCWDCGATHVPPIKTFRGDLMEQAPGGAPDELGRLRGSYRPSKKVAQEAARVRKEKGVVKKVA